MAAWLTRMVRGGLPMQAACMHTCLTRLPSDAGDVLLHTITDSILGALCLPDIGQLFPVRLTGAGSRWVYQEEEGRRAALESLPDPSLPRPLSPQPP